jgi:hypothetical protein
MPIIMLIIAIAFAVFWCYQFIFLMMMEDYLFSDKEDKLIWGLVFALVAPMAPFAFLFWRKTVLSVQKENKGTQPEN